MKDLTRKIKKHVSINSVLHSILGSVIVFVVITPIVVLAHYSYEYWTPRSVWFEYDKVVPVKSSFAEGEVLRFNSFAEIKKYQEIQWFDSLYCNDGVYQTAYLTQVFPKNAPKPIEPKILRGDDDDLWKYNEEAISLTEKECYICGFVVGYTPQFDIKKKQQWECTNPFKVNQ